MTNNRTSRAQTPSQEFSRVTAWVLSVGKTSVGEIWIDFLAQKVVILSEGWRNNKDVSFKKVPFSDIKEVDSLENYRQHLIELNELCPEKEKGMPPPLPDHLYRKNLPSSWRNNTGP